MTAKIACRAGLAVSVLLAWSATVRADEADTPDRAAPHPVSAGGFISATFENDIFGGTDRDYTNGIRVDWISRRNDLPFWARTARRGLGWLTDADDWYVTYGLGQNIYTPSDISLDIPEAGDRPYAGFLYGSVGLVADRGDLLDTIALDVGIVGPASLAEEAQTLVHDIIGAQRPNGWDTQIENEVGFRLLWERKRRFLWDFEPGVFGLQADAAPSFSVALGNVDTSASVGLTARLGDRLDDTYGPPRVQPAVAGPGFFQPTEGVGWYLFAGAAGRVVGRNIFLQGNTFTDGVDGVTPNRVVGDFQGGIALQFRSVEVTYTHVLRTREFKDQREPAQFGSVNLRFRL
ncbi:MAG: lipid A deacylase LpxR family protein [Pseudomonadota bacterium]